MRVEASSRFDSTINALNRFGEAITPARYLLADRQTSDGATRRFGVFVIADTPTGHFQWMLADPRSSVLDAGLQRAFVAGVMIAYISPDAVVIFSINHRRIDILDAPGEARGIEDAETKALQAAAHAPGSELALMSPRWRSVPLSLDGDFWSPPFRSDPGPLKILAVTKQDDGWSVLIEGQWKELITLDSMLHLLKMRRVD